MYIMMALLQIQKMRYQKKETSGMAWQKKNKKALIDEGIFK